MDWMDKPFDTMDDEELQELSNLAGDALISGYTRERVKALARWSEYTLERTDGK